MVRRRAKEEMLRQATRLEAMIDRAKRRVGRRLRPDHPLRVVSYLGHGTRHGVTLRGRVLAGARELRAASPDDSPLVNLLRALRRFETDEVSDAEVEVRFPGVPAGASTEEGGGGSGPGPAARARTDEEGYFRVDLAPPEPLPPGGGWHPLEVDLVEPSGREALVQPARVLVPPETGELIVVSDLDDTVIHTDATNLLKMLRNTVLGNSHTRMPFPGVSAFYRALTLGDEGKPRNGLFYVSSSPWNLYCALLDFLEQNGIPHGPLFLRDWGLSQNQLLAASHGDHKGGAIRDLLALYPNRRFVLIGDSGQEDPEIYSEIVHDHPDRIAAIYIRNLPLEDVERPDTIGELAEAVEEAGSRLLLVDTTFEAAEHAAKQGWISDAALGEIAREVGQDLAAPADPDLDIVEPEDRPEPKAGEPDAKEVAKDAAPAAVEA